MRNFAEKLAWAIENAGMKQEHANIAARLPKNAINSWLNKPDRKPSIFQALAVARVLAVPLEWLADDAQIGPPPGPDLTEIERFVLNVVRRLGPEESLARLAGAPSRVDAEPIRGIKIGDARAKAPKRGPA